MAVRYYDDAIVQKLLKWIPENSNLRILRPDESKRLFELNADDHQDKPIQLPIIALSRNNDIELLSNIKQLKSFNGLRLISNKGEFIPETPLLNVIPIRVQYQLDIYTKRMDEADEYIRNFIFKLINNPKIVIDIPYNKEYLQKIDSDVYLEHIANIRVLNTISDTSGIQQHIFSGQFYRWTLQLELQDAFLFSIPYKPNWRLGGIILETAKNLAGEESEIELDETFE